MRFAPSGPCGVIHAKLLLTRLLIYEKLFLVDAYALIFKYYYAFLGRPMRNRAGMNTSVVFGFVKFLRDIQKRERPDLLGVAFDPKGGSFRREVFRSTRPTAPRLPKTSCFRFLM